ncbi:MAG TPA: alpha/beta fold hydrolase [Bacilli bacterium]|nr:alpha/beta fold hydrolase [Bacilli bacterium]
MGVCLLIHGFTGTPFEVEPLAKILHGKGYEVITPTLAGHGEDRQALERVTWQDWIHSVEHILTETLKVHDKVHLVGFSMGGLIATYLAVKYRDRVESLTMMSTPIYTINPKQLFKTIAEAIQKSMRSGNRHEDIARYMAKAKGTPLRSLAHFRRLIQTVKPLVEQIEVPLLVVQGQCDDLVEPRSAEYIYENAPCADKTLHFFEESKHIICHDCEAEQVTRMVAEFIERQQT